MNTASTISTEDSTISDDILCINYDPKLSQSENLSHAASVIENNNSTGESLD